MNEFWKSVASRVRNILFRPTPPSPPPPPTPPPPTPPLQIPEALLVAHNNERQKVGVGILTLDNRLILAAAKHAEWMSNNELLSHTGSRGSNSSKRIQNEGYIPRATGENIARGYSTVTSVMQGWMSSFGHRSNILSKNYKHCGFAKVGRYWCAVFASPVVGQPEFEFMIEVNETEPLFGHEE